MDKNFLQIVNIIECEYLELELELKNNPDMAPDIKQALGELSKRKEKLLWQVILTIYIIIYSYNIE